MAKKHHGAHCKDKEKKYHRKYHYIKGQCMTGREAARHRRHKGKK